MTGNAQGDASGWRGSSTRNGRCQKKVWKPVSPLMAKSTVRSSQPSRAIVFMWRVRESGSCALFVARYSRASGMHARVGPSARIGLRLGLPTAVAPDSRAVAGDPGARSRQLSPRRARAAHPALGMSTLVPTPVGRPTWTARGPTWFCRTWSRGTGRRAWRASTPTLRLNPDLADDRRRA